MSTTGQGSISLSPKNEKAGAPFPAGSADQGLTVDPITGAIVFGQEEGTAALSPFLTNREVHTNNKLVRYRDVSGFIWSDTAQTRQIAVSFGPEPVISVDGDAAALISMTTQQPTVNGLSQIMRFLNFEGLQIRNANQVAPNQNMAIQLFDTQRMAVLENFANNRFIDIHPQIGHYLFGDVDGKFNNTFIDVDDNGNEINFVSTGGVRTTDPGSGAGAWKLGTVIAGASVVDATQFVEVSIDGVIVKLAIAV